VQGHDNIKMDLSKIMAMNRALKFVTLIDSEARGSVVG
jgi:hypothetical protein